MSEYFGNLKDVINKYIDIKNLDNGFVDVLNIHNNKTDHDEKSTAYKIQELLKNAGYKDPVWEAKSYYPNFHFSKDVVYELDNIFRSKCLNCWISELPVGKISPPHYDIDPREVKLKSFGKIVRYNIYLGDPDPGHAFFINNEVHHMKAHGDTYKWKDPNGMHSACNAGLTSKYILIYGGINFYKDIDVEYDWNKELTADSGFILWRGKWPSI